MNPLEEIQYLGKTLEEAEQMLRQSGYKEWEVCPHNGAITLQARNYPIVVLREDGKVKAIW